MKNHLQHLNLKHVHISDALWSRYINLIPNVVVPYQWDILNDKIEGAEESHCLENFRIAAGESQGEHHGGVFRDTDVYKWLEALAYTLNTHPNSRYEELADHVIELIEKAQRPDGYLHTYYTIVEPDKRWSNLTEGHELYSAGHLIEAAVAYYQATGKDRLLRVASRFADLICNTFGDEEGKLHGYPGHQEIELALVKLYRVTREQRYLDTARYFINCRGGTPNYFLEEIKKRGGKGIYPELMPYDPHYSQSHLPPREQTTAEGHAVRAVYMYSAMADIARECDDRGLRQACETLWRSITEKRMYITGSIGSSGLLERFTTDYDLPNDSNYSESCATVGLIMFGQRMGNLSREARYYDVVERGLYNTLLAAISLEGDRYFYVNPLEVWPESCMEYTFREHVKPVRQQWFKCACCPTNVARTLASLGQYIYSADADSVYVNLFINNSTELVLGGGTVKLDLNANVINGGTGTLRVTAEKSAEFEVAIRIPDYAESTAFTVNNQICSPRIQKGYAYFKQTWQGSTEIAFHFGVKAHFVMANPEVRADAGRIALQKGPIIYCFEETDNFKNLASVFVDPAQQLKEIYERDLLWGIHTIELEGKKLSSAGWNGELYRDSGGFITEPVHLKAIPYALWGNRTPGEMAVWLKASL